MRIALIEKIPVQKTFVFTAVLAIVQLVEGTSPLYVLFVFLFFMTSTIAFNTAGGLTRPSGAFILFYSTLTVGVGTIFKAILGQAADTHLEVPNLTMGVYAATAAVMLAVAYLTRKIATTRDGIAGVLHVPKLDMKTSAIGCFVVYFMINAAFAIFPGNSGSVLHAISMVNYFLPLGILLGTISAVRDSGGQRSTSTLTLAVLCYSMFTGMLTFSKQSMLTPFVCWVLGIAWARFRLRPKHVGAMIVFCVLAQEFLVPLANVGHVDGANATTAGREAIVENAVENPLRLRENNERRVQAYAGVGDWYYGTPVGILDRFTMLAVDSQLIQFTAQGHYFGYLPVMVYFQNWVPHIVDPHKLEGVAVGGNRYAHEMGQLADEDTTTGISYSPSAEAFHLGGWTSIVLLQPCLFLLLFVTTDAVCGDLRSQPWGLLPVLLFAHIAPEGLLNGTISYVWLGNVGTIFCIVISGYVTPVFGGLLRGRERVPVWRANIALPRNESPAAAEAS